MAVFNPQLYGFVVPVPGFFLRRIRHMELRISLGRLMRDKEPNIPPYTFPFNPVQRMEASIMPRDVRNFVSVAAGAKFTPQPKIIV